MPNGGVVTSGMDAEWAVETVSKEARDGCGSGRKVSGGTVGVSSVMIEQTFGCVPESVSGLWSTASKPVWLRKVGGRVGR